MADVKVSGLAELQKMLDELPAKIEANIVRGGLRTGANVIKEEAQRLVPVDEGDLKDSIRVSMRSRKGRVQASIKAGNAKAFYAHMVEFGSARHWIKATKKPGRMTRKGMKDYSIGTMNRIAKAGGSLVIGKSFVGDEIIHPGAQKKPFMRPAIDNKAEEAIEAMANYLRDRIPKEVEKLK